MVRIGLIFLICHGILFATSSTVIFHTLTEPLQKSTTSIEKLIQKPIMEPNKQILQNYLDEVRTTLNTGKELSEIEKVDNERISAYLKKLRELAHTKVLIDQFYQVSLKTAIAQSDKKSFEDLVSNPLDPLTDPRIRTKVITFYQKNYSDHSIKSIDALHKEEELEQKSIQFAAKQEQAYEENIRVLKRSEISNIKKTAKIGSRNSVMLSVESNKMGGFEFEVENLNPYTVTMSIDFEVLNNLTPSSKIPIFFEVAGQSKKRVLDLLPISSELPTRYRSSYGWIRGSVSAVHQNNYLYRLPFSTGKVVKVSQGYNGETTHKGLLAYAVDFPVPVGTPIYAAREGIVVASEGSHNIGGVGSEFFQHANYIIIEHNDGTMGNYYHLKQGGAIAVIGQKISRGELIGYSGNTGYSSGPHLHFSVNTVDPISMRQPLNVPIKMQSVEGIVTSPHKGDQYTVNN